MLYGYGGFAISMLPAWTPTAEPVSRARRHYALAVLRGGGEYGEDWHRAGMLDKKQNVFDDFIAAASGWSTTKSPAPTGWPSPGGSNGGLLVGAALTQRPDLFRAVVCKVPLLDMLRYHKFRIAGALDPRVRIARRSRAVPLAARLLAVPPRARRRQLPGRVPADRRGDTRVDPMHARKMAARLQAAQLGSRPILLRMEQTQAGHGAGKPVDKLIDEAVDTWSFLMSQIAAKESNP